MRPLLALLLVLAATPAAAEHLFSGYRVTAGPAPLRVVVKDLNSDGHADIVTVDSSATISVVLGTGGGEFGPPASYSIPAPAFRAVVADVDANGTLDIVTANPSTNNVSILWGTGSGAFNAGPNLTTRTWPHGVAVGDVNGDLRPDIVTSNRGSNAISVLKQTMPAGTFLPKVDFAFGDSATAIALGDIDSDGDLDVLCSRTATSVVARLFNDGTGNFSVGSSIENHEAQTDLALVDMNGNGTLDLVTLSPHNPAVRVHLGNGNGTFQPYTIRTIATATGNPDLEVADVNGDSKPDVVVGGQPIFLLVGNGDGTFQASVRTTFLNASGVALGDIDGDGLLDVVTVGVYPSSSGQWGPVVLLTSLPDLTFGWLPTSNQIHNIDSEVADMNGDGKPDLVLAGQLPCTVSCTTSSDFWVQLGTGVSPAIVGAPIRTTWWYVGITGSIRIGDFNEDGFRDVAVTYSGNFAVLIGDGTGRFPTQVVTANPSSGSISGVGDFDRDGHLDLTSGYQLWRGHGDGTFELFPTSLPLAPRLVVDLDGDGKLDLVSLISNSVFISRGMGDGTFTAYSLYPASTGPSQVVAGDVDRDGRLDLVVSNPSLNAVSVLLGNGAGGVGAPVSHTVTAAPEYLDLGDLNGDGWLDIVTEGARVSVLRSTGGGSFAPHEDYDPSEGQMVAEVFIRDMNQDQKPDVLLGVRSAPGDDYGYKFLQRGFTFLRNIGDGATVDVPETRTARLALAVWPNPAQGTMSFALDVAEPGPGTLEIFDLAGRVVATPFRGELPAGRTNVSWRAARAGVYWARFTSQERVMTRRVVSLGF